MTVWFIMIPTFGHVGNIMSNMLTFLVQCLYLFPSLALLNKFLEYDTEPVGKVTKDFNGGIDEVKKYTMTRLKVRLKAVGDHVLSQREMTKG